MQPPAYLQRTTPRKFSPESAIVMTAKVQNSEHLAMLQPVSPEASSAMPLYDNLYVFGDSYCDVGNLFTATRGAVPGAPYYNGRFSNGPIWVDRVAGMLGVAVTPSLRGGNDFAFGGAWVTAAQALTGGAFIPSVPQQVELYLARHCGRAHPGAMYILQGGGNDILGTASGSPRSLAFKIAARLVDCVVRLRRAGAQHFIVPNLFNVGLLPAAARRADFASAASTATNDFLTSLLAVEDELDDSQILRMDVFTLVNAVQTDPAFFGFTNMERPCLTTAECDDPDRAFFWDMHHPTKFGHVCLASTLEDALTQPRVSGKLAC
jgi:phospholipase/lecithinase/hemolysin